ncbi:PadR family transcriptional regulator [Longirhabdus pacifica]|uniref:PadR family transcriptional regulator n=1 Tax=Longirhabdus pacifica TaxID=2305227 RepID=UPI0010086C97|nr:PadR family transcriptional regulator [Longirhabdus pacifica]
MSIKHILLGVISWYPASGYGIKKEVEYKGREQSWGSISYGSIYPQLKKLEEEHFIYCYEAQEHGRATKVYDLTKKGWDELESWLSETPQQPIVRDELRMKMSFWKAGHLGDVQHLIRHLEQRKEASHQMLEHYKGWENNDISMITDIAALSMEYTNLHLKMELEWIEKTLRRLREQDLPTTKDPNHLLEKAYKRKAQQI